MIRQWAPLQRARTAANSQEYIGFLSYFSEESTTRAPTPELNIRLSEEISMSTPANAREVRLQRRFDSLTSGDAQLIAAQPDPAITAAISGPGVVLADVIRTVMTGSARRTIWPACRCRCSAAT
jgi:hypothetical protein